jgi:hypothetical protein
MLHLQLMQLCIISRGNACTLSELLASRSKIRSLCRSWDDVSVHILNANLQPVYSLNLDESKSGSREPITCHVISIITKRHSSSANLLKIHRFRCIMQPPLSISDLSIHRAVETKQYR